MKNYEWYYNPAQKMSASLANLNVKNILFSEKLLKYYDIFKNTRVKRVLNLIMHIMVMKFGKKVGKI